MKRIDKPETDYGIGFKTGMSVAFSCVAIILNLVRLLADVIK